MKKNTTKSVKLSFETDIIELSIKNDEVFIELLLFSNCY